MRTRALLLGCLVAVTTFGCQKRSEPPVEPVAAPAGGAPSAAAESSNKPPEFRDRWLEWARAAAQSSKLEPQDELKAFALLNTAPDCPTPPTTEVGTLAHALADKIAPPLDTRAQLMVALCDTPAPADRIRELLPKVLAEAEARSKRGDKRQLAQDATDLGNLSDRLASAPEPDCDANRKLNELLIADEQQMGASDPKREQTIATRRQMSTWCPRPSAANRAQPPAPQ